MAWKKHTNQLRHVGGKLGNGDVAQGLEISSLAVEETAIRLERRPASSIIGRHEVEKSPYSSYEVGVSTEKAVHQTLRSSNYS
ncbi:hypothetical protein TTRE_0000927801 [Trichuris trichiura]|uniref:Uncharacterized protein n=1 Tax=Trichuris trichiura TaxID=36087 RepID=A0A077ZM99_TRITR|nr:hypothetical protein TTRE_0000927801 [Trichuris trichiura]